MADDGPKIIVALDFPDLEQAFRLVERLSPERCRLKVGKELFVRGGPRLVERLVADGYDVFLDLKFHDIPNTVARACEAAADLGVWMVNVHALGGRRMMEAAREALDKRQRRPLLIGVTILTSMGSEDLKEIQLPEDPEVNVLHLASLAQRAGLDGVVCSPKEVTGLRREIAGDFCLVTPGIRPAWAATDDQKRITTPSEAIRLGSDYLVIGRPITAASDPLEALRKIEEELGL
ncbi:orotidine-5'-phosphate decarboxylase [Thiohalomonas denitrificans]|uniref:orotidine-5'-phosphate decarboxylase n=1 Tax=Thiohalomonas denitrificans TaxID=415747 RepID=UPI0026ED672D|nr:orotidine-5'-phosphate decarboxylase [Thiohalomonas denitrificans]